MSALVLLAVVEGALDPGEIGAVGSSEAGELAGVRIVHAAGLAVAAHEVARELAVERATLLLQDGRVRALAARWDAVLPFRFGTAVAGEGALEGALAPVAAVLREGLERVRGKEQWTLRVRRISPETAAGRGSGAVPDLKGISPSSPEGAVPDLKGISPWVSGETQAAPPGPGARYLADRARIRAAASIPGLDDLRRTLGPLVHEERVERIESHEGSGLVASVYHLVARARREDYRRALADLPPALLARAGGPFPPYAFAPLA